MITGTVTQRAAKVGLVLTKIDRRVWRGEFRMCVKVNGKRMTWQEMLVELSKLEQK